MRELNEDELLPNREARGLSHIVWSVLLRLSSPCLLAGSVIHFIEAQSRATEYSNDRKRFSWRVANAQDRTTDFYGLVGSFVRFPARQKSHVSPFSHDIRFLSAHTHDHIFHIYCCKYGQKTFFLSIYTTCGVSQIIPALELTQFLFVCKVISVVVYGDLDGRAGERTTHSLTHSHRCCSKSSLCGED